MSKHKHISLATRLKELRRARVWTQQDLSRASGLTRSYISRLEMGDIALPSSEKLRALSQALGTAPDDLLQAAGYIDSPSGADDLPDLNTYLRRKYGVDDPQVLQALSVLVRALGNSGAWDASAVTTEAATEDRDAEPRRRGRKGETAGQLQPEGLPFSTLEQPQQD